MGILAKMNIPKLFHSLLPPLLLVSFAHIAHGGAKNIERVIPRCGQQGTIVDVEIWGVSLHNPREIIFYKPGIRAFDFKLAEEQPSRRSLYHGGFWDMAISCKFEIDADCPPGQYPFRLLSDHELTHIGTFHVSPFRTIRETSESKNTIDTAMPVSVNTTINGLLDHKSPDIYRVNAKAGQRLSIELQSVQIADKNFGDSEFDLAVEILDSSGRQIAANDDNPLRVQDPVLSFLPKKDGEVYVAVQRSVDQLHHTGYVLHIGKHRRPMVVFPPGGKAGEKVSLRFIGDATGDYEDTVTIPETREFFDYIGDAPTPMRLCSSNSPNVLENTTDAETIVTQLPVALNGIIDGYDDIDNYRITVKKDEPLHVRVFAACVGSTIDPVLTIRDPDGQIELEADDSSLPERDIFGTLSRPRSGRPDLIDPSVMWTPARDGEYVISIADSSGMGGPQGIYRIDIRKPRITVQTSLMSLAGDWSESTRNTGLAIPKGGRHVVNISFPEGQWRKLDTPFRLAARGLPKGITMTGPIIDPETMSKSRLGVHFWPVLFEATEEAETGGAIIHLEAKPVDSSIEVETYSQENVPFLNHSGGDALHFTMTDSYIMGVTEPAPFSIDMQSPKAALVRGGEIAIPIKLTRHNGFEGPVEYWVRFLDLAINTQPPTTIEAGETESILRLSATDRAKLGPQPLAVIARSLVDAIHRSDGAGDRRNSTEIVTLTVAKPYMDLTSQPMSIRRGESKEFRWSIQQKTPFDGKARVHLLGLPKGLSLVGDIPEVDSNTSEVSFLIKATEEALLGQVTGLGCEIVLHADGQELTQRTGKGTLRIDPELKE